MAGARGGRTPPFTVRARRLWRQFRSGPVIAQAVVLLVIATLVADLGAVAARSGGNGSSTVSASAGDQRERTGTTSEPGAGTGPGDTTVAGGPAAGSTGASGGGTTAGTGGGTTTGGATGSGGSSGGDGGSGPVQTKCGTLAASDRGVTPTSVKVVFPWANL